MQIEMKNIHVVACVIVAILVLFSLMAALRYVSKRRIIGGNTPQTDVHSLYESLKIGSSTLSFDRIIAEKGLAPTQLPIMYNGELQLIPVLRMNASGIKAHISNVPDRLTAIINAYRSNIGKAIETMQRPIISATKKFQTDIVAIAKNIQSIPMLFSADVARVAATSLPGAVVSRFKSIAAVLGSSENKMKQVMKNEIDGCITILLKYYKLRIMPIMNKLIDILSNIIDPLNELCVKLGEIGFNTDLLHVLADGFNDMMAWFRLHVSASFLKQLKQNVLAIFDKQNVKMIDEIKDIITPIYAKMKSITTSMIRNVSFVASQLDSCAGNGLLDTFTQLYECESLELCVDDSVNIDAMRDAIQSSFDGTRIIIDQIR